MFSPLLSFTTVSMLVSQNWFPTYPGQHKLTYLCWRAVQQHTCNSSCGIINISCIIFINKKYAVFNASYVLVITTIGSSISNGIILQINVLPNPLMHWVIIKYFCKQNLKYTVVGPTEKMTRVKHQVMADIIIVWMLICIRFAGWIDYFGLRYGPTM